MVLRQDGVEVPTETSLNLLRSLWGQAEKLRDPWGVDQ